MNILDRMQKATAQFAFEKVFKKHTTIDFKRQRGGQEIIAQIRIFGWLVGEQTVLKKNPNSGPQARRVGP